MVIITWATWLTLSRIILTPFIVKSLVYEQWMQAGILFAVAALSDIFDGALARYAHQETQLGAYLDPLADKLLIVSCYLTLLWFHGHAVGIPAWLVGAVVVRELLLVTGALVLYVRSLLSHKPFAAVIYPSLIGKWTTVIHCVLLGSIYAVQAGLLQVSAWYIHYLSALAVIFMTVSFFQYACAWLKLMKKMSGVFVLLISCCVPSILTETNNEFTVQRPATGLQGRQKLREEFAELVSEYLELLVEELSLVAKRLSLTDMPCTEREQKKSEVYTRVLYEVQQFLRDGSVVIVQPACCHDEQGDSRALCGFLIDGIAGTQREVIRVLHSMLERDAQCCFVACKTKSQWERYIQRMRRFISLTAEQNGYLRTIVQNFEKSSC